MTDDMPVRWLVKGVVLAIHDALLIEHGGAPGIRDEGLLESALARPQHLFHYERSSSIPQLAAAYGFGLSSNHPFADGNKRIAFSAMALFLELNGWRLEAEEPETVVMFTELAAGIRDETELADWLRNNSRRED